MIKLVVDARPLTRTDGGIKRYTASILKELLKDSTFNIILYLDQELSTQEFEFLHKTQSRIYDGPVIFMQMLWFVYIQKWLKSDKPDIFWSPRHHLPRTLPKSTKTVVTIHDVIWKSHPQTMKKAGYFNERLHMPRSIQQADLIFTPSEYTSSEIKKYWPSADSKISTIKHGIDFDDEDLTSLELEDKKYVLAVGTLEPRKNYSRLIQAFDNWAKTKEEYELIIIGRYGWKTQEINKALANSIHSSRIRILSDVDDEELKEYYQQARAFIQISIAEGFGLPIIEAQSYGLTLMLSDIPIFREIAGDSDAIWVDPFDLSSIESGLTKCIQPSSPVTKNTPKIWKKTGYEISEKLKALV